MGAVNPANANQELPKNSPLDNLRRIKTYASAKNRSKTKQRTSQKSTGFGGFKRKESKNMNWLQAFWQTIKSPESTNLIMAVATAIIAFYTVFTFRVVKGGSVDTRNVAEAALAANRAWVAPDMMILGSPVESGLPLKYQIHIVNVGREPALSVTWKTAPQGVAYIAEGADANSVISARNDTCVGLEPGPLDGTVLYPTQRGNFWIPLTIPDTPHYNALIQRVVNRQQSLLISGCIAYRTTDGKARTSSFQFFLRDIPGPSFAMGKDGQSSARWNFNVAVDGNSAN